MFDRLRKFPWQASAVRKAKPKGVRAEGRQAKAD
jgi:hypothetical protein